MSLKAGTLEWIPDGSHPPAAGGSGGGNSVRTDGVLEGPDDPEGSVVAAVGTIYNQIDANGNLVATKVKLTGSGNTGWG